MSELRIPPSGQPVVTNAGQDATVQPPSAPASLGSMIALLQSMPAAPAVAAQANASLVSNANGAPSLPASSMDFSPDALILALADAQNKSQQAQLDTLQLGLKADTKKKEAETQRSIEKIKDWVKKYNEAKAKASGILGWFKKIFTALAAALAVAAAAVATAATGGAAAPLLAVTTLTLASSLVSIASEISKAAGGSGFDSVLKWMDPGSLLGMGMGELAKSLGASDEQAAIVSTSFAVATTIAIAVSTVVLTGGAGVQSAVEGFQKTLLMAARIGQTVAGAAAGATQMAQGAVNMSIAADERDAAKIEADRKAIEAILAKLQQQMEDGREDLKKVMDAMMESTTIVSQIIHATDESHAQITTSLAGRSQLI